MLLKRIVAIAAVAVSAAAQPSEIRRHEARVSSPESIERSRKNGN